MSQPDRDTFLGMFETMATIRACDDRFQSVIMSGQAMLMYYSPRGQEAIAAGVGAHLRPEDYVVTTYRGLHDHIAKGVPLRELWAEFLGRATGTCKGKGGGMHITHPASGLMVTTGIVGGGLPIANGLALAAQERGEDRVTVCNFGDGAANIGAFHESLNLAGLWNLPIVFCCQNNGYAEHTRFANSTRAAHIADRAAGYGIRGLTVDGADPVVVHAAAGEAIERARSGHGPTLLELTTNRCLGHFFGEDTHYMPKDEVAAALATDPVTAFRAWLLDNEHASEDDLTSIEKQIQAGLDDAVDFAMGSPFPETSEIRHDVYHEEVLVR